MCLNCCTSELLGCSPECEVKIKQLDELYEEYWRASQAHYGMTIQRQKEAKSISKRNLFIELEQHARAFRQRQQR
jgi:hypothetical protein